MARYGMVMDMRRCIGCHACEVACKAENKVPLGVWRTQVRYYEKGRFPHVRRYFFLHICDHCTNPPCVTASRNNGVGAFYQREDGIVLIDLKKLTKGRTRKQIEAEVQAAIEACHAEAIYVDPLTGLPGKCTFCVHRVDAGLVPACVQTCVGRARIFGDFDDPNSEVSRLAATLPARAMHPDEDEDTGVLYIAQEGGLIDGGAVEGFRQIDPQDFETGKLSLNTSPAWKPWKPGLFGPGEKGGE